MANEFTARNGLIAQKDSVVTGSLIVTSGITGSLLGTASYAAQALSSSYASAYAAVFPYTGSAIISGSLTTYGANNFNGNVNIDSNAGFLQIGGSTLSNFLISLGQNPTVNGIQFQQAGATNRVQIKGFNTSIQTMNLDPGGSFSYLNMGNISIGSVTNAGYKLDVNGSTRLFGDASVSGSLAVNYTSLPSIYKLGVGGSAVVKGAIVIQDDSGALSAYSTDGLTSAGGFLFNQYVGVTIYSSNVNPIKFSVSGSENMRLFSTKNVSIGSTTDAGFRLDVSGSSRFNGNMIVTGSSTATSFSGSLRTTGIMPITTNNINIGDGANYFGSTFTQYVYTNNVSTNNCTVNTILYGTPNGGLQFLNSASIASMKIINATNNIIMQTGGTFTDAGFKLDVQGTTRFNGNTQITGSINQSGTIVASSAVAKGAYLTPILSASANNDYLVGLDIQPNYVSSSYTNTTPVGLRVTNPGGGVITIGQNTNFSFVNEILCTGRLDFGSTVSQLFMRGTQIYFVGPTVLTRTGDATSTATQKSSYAFPMQTSLWTGAVQSLVNAGFAHKASTTVNLASRLAAVVNTTGTDLNTSGTEALTIFSPSANVLLAASGSTTFTDDGYRLDVVGTSRFNGNMLVTGSVTATSFTGSLLGTASWATNALTSSTTAAVNGTATFLPYFNTSTSLANTDITLSGSNYGISITTPRTKLMINNGDLSAYNTIGSGSTGLGAQIYIGDGNFQNANYYNSAPGIGAVWSPVSGVMGDLALYTYNNLPSSRSENMRLFRGGGVSIGTSITSSYKFDVNGTSRFNGNMSITGSQNSLYFNYISNPNAVATAAAKVQLVNAAGNSSVVSLASDSDSTDPSLLSIGGSNKGLELTSNSVRAFRIFDATRNVIIQNGGTFTDAGYRLDVQGTSRFTSDMIVTGSTTFQGTTTTDAATLSNEQLTTGTGTNWSGTSFALGYTHATGSTTPLVSSLNAGIGTYYQIIVTISSRTAGSIGITFGSSTTGFDVNQTSIIGFRSGASTPVFTVTPTSDFNGTVVVSVKYVTLVMPPISTYKTSTGVNTLEIRSNTNAQNTFIGVNSGRFNTTGSLNTVLGYNALPNNIVGTGNTVVGVVAGVTNTSGNYNTYIGNAAGYLNPSGSHNVCLGNSAGFGSTGTGNTFIGSSAGGGSNVNGPNNAVGFASLLSTTTGASNDAYGYTSLYSNTSGSFNIGVGREAGYSNTTGDSNLFFGYRAGRFIASSAENTVTTNSIFIGHQTRALANNQTNQIVIGYGSTGLGSNTTVLGNSSTLTTAIYGNTLIGTTTDAGFKLDVNGTSRFNGNMQISGSGAFMAMTSNAGDAFAFKSNGAIRLEAQNVGILYASTTVTALYARGTTANITLGNQTTTFATMYGNTGNLSIQNGGTYVDSGYKLDVSGSTRIKGPSNTSISSSLLVYGSGSAQPVFTVQGSQGELFSVTDSLSGSLFSVNDISGLPVLEAFSDNTVLLGSYQAPALLTTNKIVLTASGNFTLSSLPTASYDGAFYDYTVRSGSNARAGTIMAIWSGSSVNFTETTTTSFGSTTGLNLGVFVSGGNMVLTGSASTTAWTIKTIIRSI